jgi:hypothetical protein
LLSEVTESPELVAAPALAGSGAGLASACLAAGFAVSAAGLAAAEVAGWEGAGFDAAGALAFAAGLEAEVVGVAAAFGFAAALGFAAAFGFAGALGLVGASAAAFDVAEAGFPAAFGFELGAAVPVGFAVADFGPPFAPALGAGFRFLAAGLRVPAPGFAARAVRVVPGVEAPVLLPPARVPAGV